MTDEELKGLAKFVNVVSWERIEAKIWELRSRDNSLKKFRLKHGLIFVVMAALTWAFTDSLFLFAWFIVNAGLILTGTADWAIFKIKLWRYKRAIIRATR